MAFGDKKTESRPSLIEQKMKTRETMLADIDFDSIYDEEPSMHEGEMKELKEQRKTFFVYGHKNDGKTIVSYGLLNDGESALVLSFDNKSERPLDAREGLKALKNAPITIKVINTSKYYNQMDSNTILTTAEKTYHMVVKILDDFADPENVKAKINGKKPDWIIIDGTEKMNTIMEMYMRKSNGLMPNAGVPQNCWKDRKQYLNNIYSKCLLACNIGVIYTSFVGVDELIDNCTTIQKKEVPKWIGDVRDETDIQIRAIAFRDGKKSKYIARIHGSKYPSSYPDDDYDVTDTRLVKVLENVNSD